MSEACKPGRWRWMLIHDERDEIDTAVRHVGLTLAVHADDDGTGARPSVEELARTCRRKRETIRRALEVLAEHGYIDRRQPSRRAATRYRLTAPTAPSGHPRVPTEPAPPGTHSPRRVGPLRDPSGHPTGSEWAPPSAPTTNNQQQTCRTCDGLQRQRIRTTDPQGRPLEQLIPCPDCTTARSA